MFYEAMVTNVTKSTLFPLTQITGGLSEPTNYQTVKIDGLAPVKTQLNFSNAAAIDGAFLNSARTPTRNIVITVKIKHNHEAVRNLINSVFYIKDLVRLVYKTDLKEVYIDGYVESVEYSPFEKSEIVQISIICPDPYFETIEEKTVEAESAGGVNSFTANIETFAPTYFRFIMEAPQITAGTYLNIFGLTLSRTDGGQGAKIGFEDFNISKSGGLEFIYKPFDISAQYWVSSASPKTNLLPYMQPDARLIPLSGGQYIFYTIQTEGKPYNFSFFYKTRYLGI